MRQEDHTITAIERHKAAWEALEAAPDLDMQPEAYPLWDAANEEYEAAVYGLTETPPSTLASVRALLAYIVELGHCPLGDIDIKNFADCLLRSPALAG